MRKAKLMLIASLLAFLGISDTGEAVAGNQTKIACQVVKNWPNDYVKVWPMAVAFHNKASNTNTANSYMENYVETYKTALKITDKNALHIFAGYEAYWGQLESDYIHNGGKQPAANSPSSKILSMVMRLCGVK